MDQTTNREHLESSPFPEGRVFAEKPKRPEGSREVKEKAREVLKTEGKDANEGMAEAEAIDGKISESAGEDKAVGPASIFGATVYTADEVETIRAKLLAALPPQEEMVRQIRRTLQREEKILSKRMTKLTRRAHRHAFELAIVVSQLRKVREYFGMLAHATFELVKHLWLKIVHGV